MRSFTVDEITQIVGGMLTKVASPEITHIAPPLLSDEHTLALALGEELQVFCFRFETLQNQKRKLPLYLLVFKSKVLQLLKLKDQDLQ